MPPEEEARFVPSSPGRRIRLIVSWFFFGLFLIPLWILACTSDSSDFGRVMNPLIVLGLLLLRRRSAFNKESEPRCSIPRLKDALEKAGALAASLLMALLILNLILAAKNSLFWHGPDSKEFFLPLVCTLLVTLVVVVIVALDVLEITGQITWKTLPEKSAEKPSGPRISCQDCGITLRAGAPQCHWCGWQAPVAGNH